MTGRQKKILKFSAKLLVTVGLLLWVFSKTDLLALAEAFKNARWLYLGPLWILTVVAYWLLSFKMRIILARQHCRLSTWSVFAASAITSLYGLVLPGLLDTSVKWYILKRYTGKGTHVFSSMVYNQLTFLLVTIVSALAALIVTNPSHNQQLPLLCAAVLVILITSSYLLLHPRTGPKMTALLGRLTAALPAVVRTPAEHIFQQLGDFQLAPWSFHATVLLLSLASTTGIGTVIYIFAAKAAHIEVPVGVLIWQCALIFVLGRLPISIANFGVREATFVSSLALYDVPGSSALLMSTIILSTRLLIALIGAALQLRWSPSQMPVASNDQSD